MKQCLPIMASSFDEVKSLVREKQDDVDLIEIRLDCIEEKIIIKNLKKELGRIKKITDKPIILTYRTKSEGGVGNMNIDEYNKFILSAINNFEIDYLDIELFSAISDANCKMYGHLCRQKNIKTIFSRHELLFPKTEREIELLLMRMYYLGCDIPKIVSLVKDENDVNAIVRARHKVKEKIDKFICIGMGELGRATRDESMVAPNYINFVKAIGSKNESAKKFGQL